MRRIEDVLYWFLFAFAIGTVILALSSCSKPNAHVIRVPSSAPYRYITWSPKDTESTQKQVRAHNRRHQIVKRAEAKAKTKQSGLE